MSTMLGYANLRAGAVARTVQVSPSILFDLDSDDRILGAETLDDVDWRDGLAALAMAGRLTVPERGDLWP